MSDSTTKKMLRAYFQDSPVTLFFAGMFQSPARNFHNTETVEIDIERDDEDVAVAVQDLSAGYRQNSVDLFTNKEFKPPIFKESTALNAFDLIKRVAGMDPFADKNFQAEATLKAFKAFRRIEAKIRRAIELQASQVMQTGVVTLKDSSGVSLYNIDYKPKTTHFPTVGTAWSNHTSSDPRGDIMALSDVIRADGKTDADQLVFGQVAFENFIKNEAIQKLFDVRRFNVGRISSLSSVGQGANYRGTIDIGNYSYDCFSYNGRYKDPETGTNTPYMDPNKVVVRASTGRFDATFGAIPRIVPPEARALRYLPSRINGTGRGIDMNANAWTSDDGEQLFVGVGSRPLMIPTQIDSYGCLTTTV